jgi:hypothetical protein
MYQMLIRYSEREDNSIRIEMRLSVKLIIMTSVIKRCWKTLIIMYLIAERYQGIEVYNTIILPLVLYGYEA